MIPRRAARILLAPAAVTLAVAGAALVWSEDSPPPPQTTRHVEHPSSAEATATPNATASAAAPVDPLARPVIDDEAQQLLEDVTPGILDAAGTAPLVEQAWTVLADDMRRGGWSQHRRRAAVVVPVPVDTAGAGEQVEVIVWSAVTPAGYVDDAGRSTLRLARESGSWKVLSIG